MEVTYTIRNLERVLNAVSNIHLFVPRASDETVEKTANDIMKRMKIYPSPPAGSRYVRNFKLRDAWRVQRVSRGFSINANPMYRGVSYARYVVGDDIKQGQASIHVGRWNLFRNVADEEIEGLPITIAERIRSKVAQEGLS